MRCYKPGLPRSRSTTLKSEKTHQEAPLPADQSSFRLHQDIIGGFNDVADRWVTQSFVSFVLLTLTPLCRFCYYLLSGVVSFSLLAGASWRSGRLAKSSCSASPIARDRTTIFPSLDTQTNKESQDHTGTVCRNTTAGWGRGVGVGHTRANKKTRTNRQWRQHTQHTFILCTKRKWERGGRPLSGIYNVFTFHSISPKSAFISCICTEVMNIIKSFKCKQELHCHVKNIGFYCSLLCRLNKLKFHKICIFNTMFC